MPICFAGGACLEVTDIIIGSDGDDTILGDSPSFGLTGIRGADLLIGNGGDDLIAGEWSQDRLKGGDGNDVVVGGGITSSFWDITGMLDEDIKSGISYIETPHPVFFAEVLSGGAGNDILIGGSWDDASGDGIVDDGELLLGAADLTEEPGFNNIAWGGSGSDQLYGANGFDTLGGGSGDDILYGYGSADIIYGGAGNDTIYGGDGDTISLHRLDGNSVTVREELYGGAGNDTIYGEGGVDIIYGGDGDDRIDGGTGADTLTGGAGADSFVYPQDTSDDVVSDFDVSEDQLIFVGLASATVDAYISNAAEATIDGATGLLIEGAGASFFLVGVSVDDISAIQVTIAPFTGAE